MRVPVSGDKDFNNKRNILGNQARVFRFDEDASEILNLSLNGGPKWGFRIKQLTDNRVIVSRIGKGPALKCGLKVYDEILAVNNVPLGNEPRSLLINQEEHQNSPEDAENQHHMEVDRVIVDENQPLTGSSCGQGASTSAIQLSKLDFAYQLIKHSSIMNKLMLTVRRYLNPGYARASVVGSNGKLPLGSDIKLQSDSSKQMSAFHLKNKPSIHYSYKCCECYCDNEGKFKSQPASQQSI